MQTNANNTKKCKTLHNILYVRLYDINLKLYIIIKNNIINFNINN